MDELFYVNDPDAVVWAAADGVLELVVRLVDAGADVNTKCDDGRSALHMAAKEGRSDIAEFLLSRGADPNITDADGDTPHDYAVFYRCEREFAALLVGHGATVREGQSAKQHFQDALDRDLATIRAFQNLTSLINESKNRNA